MDQIQQPDPSPQLKLEPDSASPPAAAPAAPAASPPAPEPVVEKPAAARAGSRASTKARVSNPKPKTGARTRKKAEIDPAGPEPDRVAVVLKTSRYTGRNGRAVARKSTVMVTVDRGLKLIMLDHAREASEDEAAAAAAGDPILLD